MQEDDSKYYTPKKLGIRWDVDDGWIRKLCKANKIANFRLCTVGQTTYRIPKDWVHEFEQQNTFSNDTEITNILYPAKKQKNNQ